MRSLRYILSGHCHNFDDCLHRSANAAVSYVGIDVRVQDHASDVLLVSQIVASFEWHFADGVVRVERIYAAMQFGDSHVHMQRVLQGAQRRLGRDLDRLKAAGIALRCRSGSQSQTNELIACDDLLRMEFLAGLPA